LVLIISSQMGAVQARDAETQIGSRDTTPINTTEPAPFRTITTTVQIDAGDNFYIQFDPEGATLVVKPPFDLPEECDQALEAVPEWLKENLTYKYRQLSQEMRVTYANLIMDSPDERYIDEIAFCIAHSAVDNLQDDYMFPQIFTHNAQLIYDADQYLDYVRIVEKGNYTTVVYKDKNGVEVELVAPPVGKFWRDWLFYENDSGHPLFLDRIQDSETLWEAISACNGWVSGSMSFTSNEERPIQPVRIYRKHIGRCGEYQDMRNAIARAALIPSVCTSNPAEDHAWNEFWDQRWIHWDGGVDNPRMYENGWGKKISSVWNTRGDSDIWSVSNKYTDLCTYTATVLDDSGLPVDGAKITVETENYYNPDLLTTTTWGTTDYTGRVMIPLGDSRNYWSTADSSDLGEDPPYGRNQIITDSQIGADYNHTFTLPRSAPSLKANEDDSPPEIDERLRMEIDFQVVSNVLRVRNSYTGEHGDLYSASGNIDFFIADQINYNLYSNDLIFNAHEISERSEEGMVSFILPSEDIYTAVFSNEFSLETMKTLTVAVKIFAQIQTEITSPNNDAEFDLDDIISITGTAWGPEGIDDVEIEVDGSGSWESARDTSTAQEDTYTTWEYGLDTKGFTTGAHTIRARASRGGDFTTSYVNISLSDVTKPNVDIESPTQGSKFMVGDVVEISGSATDNHGISKLELVIESDRIITVDIISTLSDGEWSYQIANLDHGDYSVTVIATDHSSNWESVTMSIKILESVAPNVRIDSPSKDQVFKHGDVIDISGTASDNSKVSSLEIIIDNEVVADVLSSLKKDGVWTYQWNTDSASRGSHVMEVKATDGSGNTAYDDTNVILDGVAPEVSISVLDVKEAFNTGEGIPLTGIASDDWSLDEVTIMIDDERSTDITREVDGGVWQYIFDDTVGLESGTHTIKISATDSVGHSEVESITVIIDAMIPTLEISQIDGPVRIGSTLRLSGSANDDIGIVEVLLILDDDEVIDISSKLVGGNWEYDLETSNVFEGRYTISVIVKDMADNQVSQQIRVTFVKGDEVTEEESPSSDGGLSSVIRGDVCAILTMISIIGVFAIAISNRKRR